MRGYIKDPFKNIRRNIRNPMSGREVSLDKYADLRVRPFYVIEDGEKDDYIECRLKPSDEAESTDRVFYIAKPYRLRKTPFDGETVTDILTIDSTDFTWSTDEVDITYDYTDIGIRRASASLIIDGLDDPVDVVEIQVITPKYREDEMILAVSRKTKVENEEDEGTVVWEEIAPFRAWNAALYYWEHDD